MTDFKLLDVRLQEPQDRRPFNVSFFPDGTPATEFYRTDTGYMLRFPGLADFKVSADLRDVTCAPAPNVSEETPEHL